MSLITRKKRRENNRVCMIAYRALPKFFNRLKIAQSLCNDGYEVDFICPNEGDQKKTEVLGNILVIRTGNKMGKWCGYLNLLNKYLLFCLRSFLEIIKMNKEKKYTFFHIHTPPDFLILIAIPLKLIYGSKIILDLHDMFPESVDSNLNVKGKSIIVYLAKMIEKFAVFFSDAVICTNSYDKQIVSSRNKINPDKIFTVMNVPNLKQFQIESSKKKDFGFDGKYIVLFEGTIWKRRGIQTVIDAVELLKDKIPVYFLIVGDGPYKEDLQKIVVEKNLTNFVELTGWVDLTTLSRYLSISDICVIPFLKTKVNDRGVPNKLFEYTIHEKPVIASRLKGMSMTFSNEEILFCEAGDSKDFANKILWSYENPENAKKMALSAKNRYLREYTWKAMEYELHRCYESLQDYKKENLGEKEPYSSPESV